MNLADAAGAEAEGCDSLVAPLLQLVAADVQHWVKSRGYTRMPTRGELRKEGESRSCDACHHIAMKDCPSLLACLQFLPCLMQGTCG